MKRPNKTTIRKAIFVTSLGCPTRYFLHVRTPDGDHIPGVWNFAQLHQSEVFCLSAANALVRTMREHVHAYWTDMYAYSSRQQRIAKAARK